MARSYFSRVVEGSRLAALTPPRPVSSLWKTARVAQLGQGADQDLGTEGLRPGMRGEPSIMSPNDRNSSPRNEQRRRNPQTLAAAPGVAAPAATHVTSGPVPSHKPLNSESVATPPSAAVPKTVSTRRTHAKDAASEDSKPVLRPTDRQRELRATGLPPEPASSPALSPALSPASGRASRTSKPPAASPQSVAKSPDVLQPPASNQIGRHASPQPASPEPPVQVSPGTRQPVRDTANALREAISADARAEIIRRFSPRPQPEPQWTARHAAPSTTADPIAPQRTPYRTPDSPAPALLEPSLPTQNPVTPPRAHRSTTAPPPREPIPSLETPRTTVQIGKIEVQVIPPIATVRPAAPAAEPKQRLARGYALWPGR